MCLCGDTAYLLPAGWDYCRCPYCGKALHRSSLSVHVRDQHRPSTAICCKLCHRMFRTKNSLKVHRSLYHRDRLGPPSDLPDAAPGHTWEASKNLEHPRFF
ncbi:hypothetical protein PR048_032464 [Dryococelus australis]|uniref:C2H2-type domain-containing protein n=1 Tax=Dryococelus australis TaxID=614101 RepID=A0ABQ9G296_9NEOP|nr:hypothetical protein PR048_032464 [Dryococelus australis]